jgi:hypothetical protein
MQCQRASYSCDTMTTKFQTHILLESRIESIEKDNRALYNGLGERLKRTIELSVMDLESDWTSHVKRCKIIYNGCYIALQTISTIDSTAGFTTLSEATLALNDEKPSPHVARRVGLFFPELRRKLVLRLQSRAGHSLELVPVSKPGFNLGFNPHSKTCSVSRFINIFAS